MKLKKSKKLLRNRIAPVLVIALIAGLLRPAQTQAAERCPIIVELLTSQGCSSCLPADELLDKLLQIDSIVGLSSHVDYWDYIGWKYPFALPENTSRQRAIRGLSIISTSIRPKWSSMV